MSEAGYIILYNLLSTFQKSEKVRGRKLRLTSITFLCETCFYLRYLDSSTSSGTCILHSRQILLMDNYCTNLHGYHMNALLQVYVAIRNVHKSQWLTTTKVYFSFMEHVSCVSAQYMFISRSRLALACVAQLVGASSYTSKGCGFDPQSAHVWEANN